MDRLTYRTGAGTPNLNYPAHITEDQIAKSAFRQMAIERLAAYEDTGLEPEEIDHLRSLAEMVSGIAPDRLRELVEADREGRCVVLPCKVGEYWVRDGKRYIIAEITMTNAWGVMVRHYEEGDGKMLSCNPQYFAQHYTREEAEDALKSCCNNITKNCDKCKHVKEEGKP